jgi:hypothetical protein
MKSRAISIILSLVMCATMFPLQVVAETLNEKYTESVSTVSQNSIELTQKSKDLHFTTPATMNIDLWVNGEEITPENAETAGRRLLPICSKHHFDVSLLSFYPLAILISFPVPVFFLR